ncbi:hypothetical protein XENOCAPTIV_003654, partial [Xenoophorus captivus]
GPSVPSATMTATSWRSTPPSTPPRRSSKPFRPWCSPSNVRSKRLLIGSIRAAVMPLTATSTANQQTAQRRMIPVRSPGRKPKILVRDTG